MSLHIDFELFRPELDRALAYGDGAKGGRPAYDAVMMFRVLVLASMHNLSDERMEFLIRDRITWLRFPGFDIGDVTPDARTIWLFREKLTEAGVVQSLFSTFDASLQARSYKPTGGQIVDPTLVSAPRQRMTRCGGRSCEGGRGSLGYLA